jgi:hypothetical protein
VAGIEPPINVSSILHSSFWHQLKFPLDDKFSESYVLPGIGSSGDDAETSAASEKQNIAAFVRKTKELLLSQDVLKEVEAAAPGDKVKCIFFSLKFAGLSPVSPVSGGEHYTMPSI